MPASRVRAGRSGPGSYPSLGWGLDNKVSSGRRISNDYPYNAPPNRGSQ